MRFRYKMSEADSAPGGNRFVVRASIELDDTEARLHKSYNVQGFILIGKEFTEVKGVDTLGDVKLDQFLGRTAEFQFPTIQMASDFVAKLGEGLADLKKQIAATHSAISALGREVELEF
jgi:hypothetical protein